MRSVTYVFALVLLTCCNPSACLAQQPTGPRTLENLLNSDNTQKPATAAVADATDASPKQPAGTLARPKDGVQHPNLDKAWADYDKAVTKAAEGIRAAINKQFDAATAKGDLDAAEKWQKAQEEFQRTGELPAETGTKSAVTSAVADYKRAKDELVEVYESVVKSLTMEKKLGEARAAKDESQGLADISAQGSRGAAAAQSTVKTTKKETLGFRLVPADAPDQCVAALTNGVRLVSIDKSDDTACFKIVPGLADPQAVSFESLARPGHFLRHAGYRLHLHAFANEDLFRKDATFLVQNRDPAAKSVSLQSKNYPSHLMRHRNGELWIDKGNDQTYFQQTAFKLLPLQTEAPPAPATLLRFQDSIGKTLTFHVVAAANGGGVWGSNPYTADSALARAAVHAGILQPGEAGLVRVTILPGQQTYAGSTKNGVSTGNWGSYSFSYLIERGQAGTR